MSSNDFDGPYFRPAGGREADEQGAGARDPGEQAAGEPGPGKHAAGEQGTGQQGAGQQGQQPAGGPRYRAPEGWGNDGFWRDSSVDSDFETGLLPPVPPAGAPHEDPGFSYWEDGQGWQRAPRGNSWPGQTPAGPASAANPAPYFDPARPAYDPARPSFDPSRPSFDPARPPFGADLAGPAGPGGAAGGYAPTMGVPAGYGGPAGPGQPGGTGGFGLGGPPVPGGFGDPGGPAFPGGAGYPSGSFPGGPGYPGGPGSPGGPGGPTGPGGPAGSGPGGPRGPQGPGGRRKGSWWRHWSWKKALAVTGCFVLLMVLAVFGVYEYLSSSATIPTALASANYQDTTVYYSDGKTVLGTFGATNRQDLTYAQMPATLQNAVIAAEDKNFWTEGGISPTGILRAAIHDVTNGGGDLNGGSTITQEFVRGYYDGVGTQQTASRKIKEIFISQKLVKTYSKQWILTNYLNLIYLGENSYGVEAAAETYFGKPAAQLTVAQDAVLAGIIQQPSTYPLESNRAALKARWQYVLQQMLADKYITAAQLDSAKFPVLNTDKAGSASASTTITASKTDPWAPYVMSVVENELTGVDSVSQQELETGGLKIVTTVSRAMEKKMYAAVSANLNSQSISETSGATVTSLPSWALVGAELQKPGTGEILAMYPGKGQDQPAKQCKISDCDVNTAVYAREQVGSSFKPYVLSAAVAAGMNVKTSILNASQELCIPPDTMPKTLSTSVPFGTTSCGQADYFAVSNDGGEVIGDGSKGGATTVQNALAQSSNTAFTDLAHTVGTAQIADMAGQFGVNLAPYSEGGSGLKSYDGEVGMALGIAPLTVNEQTTMLATIADGGTYHQAHVIQYWQQGANGARQSPKIDTHIVLTPAQDAQVQYAMEETTVDGTAAGTVTYGQQTLGTVIGKTGTTTNSHSGFFIGSTTQYTMVVGMFTSSGDTNSNDNLSMLGGGGFGGYWPAKIWNTFAESVFSPTPSLFNTAPTFAGTTWNQVGAAATAKPTVTCRVNGKKVKITGKKCPAAPIPSPSPACSYPGENQYDGCTTPTCTYQGESQNDGCVTASASAAPACTQGENPSDGCSTASASAAPTCTQGEDPNDGCTSVGTDSGGVTTTPTATTPTVAAPTVSTSETGLAVGDVVLPGSLLGAAIACRRRRRIRRRAGSAE